jgi:hypothetical protein
MSHQFTIEPQALKRCYSVYVVVAKTSIDTKLYVGKTGDNREGCNPIISRCGNHFSYNKIHSQIRNKLNAHEDWSYTYVFDHFDEYPATESLRRPCIDRINEMERWLNELVQEASRGVNKVDVLNPYKNRSNITLAEQQKRASFRDNESRQKLDLIVKAVEQILVQS